MQLSPERIQLAGIKTVAVDFRPVVRQTKTVGYVTYDESRLSRVVSRVDGYVEKLYVDTTFTMVHKGDRLAEIYSPELYSTAQELILAEPQRRRARPGSTRGEAPRCWASVRRRSTGSGHLEGTADRLVIRSPQSGYVVDKKIVAGATVEAEMTLLGGRRPVERLGRGRRLRERHPLPPARPEGRGHGRGLSQSLFRGELAAIYPQLDATTRTNRIRFELDNPRL